MDQQVDRAVEAVPLNGPNARDASQRGGARVDLYNVGERVVCGVALGNEGVAGLRRRPPEGAFTGFGSHDELAGVLWDETEGR
jgi:hypothetical protein